MLPQRQLDTPDLVRSFIDNTPGDAILLVTKSLGHIAENQVMSLPGLPVAYTSPMCLPPKMKYACRTKTDNDNDNDNGNNDNDDDDQAFFLQHGRCVSMAHLDSGLPLMFMLASHFHNTQYAPIIVQPPEVCRGPGHIHVHLSTCMVIPRFAKACDHMRVLHKLLQFPLIMERVCLHVHNRNNVRHCVSVSFIRGANAVKTGHEEEPCLTNDLGDRLVGARNILSFLAGMHVLWHGQGEAQATQKKGIIEINASFSGNAPVRVRDGGIAAAT